MTFNPQRWLAAIPARQDDLRVFAENLVIHADHLGELDAATGFLRKAMGVKPMAADRSLHRLRESGLITVVRRGDARTRTPTRYALTYSATSVTTGSKA